MKWYAKYREPETGEWLSLVTPYRMTDPGGKRKALVWAAELDRVGEATKGTAQTAKGRLLVKRIPIIISVRMGSGYC